MSKKCLNCDAALLGKFCHQCGQKASTHRITFKSFVTHDLVHGIWHVDKGILYTVRTLLSSPGYAVKSFLSGKRVMHYNIFALFIIVITLKTLIDGQLKPGNVFQSDNIGLSASDEKINQVINNYYKALYLISIPVLSCFTILYFRKLRYNFSEHIVFNCFILTGAYLYALAFSLTGWLIGFPDLKIYAVPVIAAYLVMGYFQATRGLYTTAQFSIRSIAALVCFLLAVCILTLAAILTVYGGEFEGVITL